MGNKVKNGLFIFLFSILMLPLWQQCFPFINSGALYGVFFIADDVDFSWQKWDTGGYQKQKSKFINDHIGFRPDLIRLNDQVDYSLFKKVHSRWETIVGDNNCLYQDIYVYSYLGQNFVGYDTVLKKMIMLKAIQDTMARLGKSLILVHSPCKAFYYPEYFPAGIKKMRKGTNNFDTYIRVGDSLGINQINFNSWFVAMKDTCKELLYPRQGFHWSVYGSQIAADSLTRYIERLRNIHMPHAEYTGIIHTTQARYTDDDIAKDVNLIFPVTTETFSYPEVHYKTDATTVKPKVIYIGDSFIYTWIYDYYMDNANTDWELWYYNTYLYNKDNRQDRQQEISAQYRVNTMKTADCIVIMYTSRNLTELGDGFIEMAYDHYYPKNKTTLK